MSREIQPVRFSIRMIVTVLVLIAAGFAAAEEPPKKEDEQVSKKRMALMQSTIDALKLSSEEIPDAGLKSGKSPLLRYNDPTRGLGVTTQGLLDAGVWRIGETGRPTALVTLEIYGRPQGDAVLSHEFVTLTPAKLSLSAPNAVIRWSPARTEVALAVLPDAPVPARTPKSRLTQMRQLTRRFAVRETLADEQKVECRLLPQPIDRYSDERNKIVDGAMFVFANGTNPELALLLESDSQQWSYGVVRLSSAALVAQLDGTTFFEGPVLGLQDATAPYRGVGYPVPLPE